MINEEYFNKTIKELMQKGSRFDFKLIDDWMWVKIDEDTLVRMPYESYDLPEGKFEIKGSSTKFLELAMGTEKFVEFGKNLRKKAIEKGLIPEDLISTDSALNSQETNFVAHLNKIDKSSPDTHSHIKNEIDKDYPKEICECGNLMAKGSALCRNCWKKRGTPTQQQYYDAKTNESVGGKNEQ